MADTWYMIVTTTPTTTTHIPTTSTATITHITTSSPNSNSNQIAQTSTRQIVFTPLFLEKKNMDADGGPVHQCCNYWSLGHSEHFSNIS